MNALTGEITLERLMEWRDDNAGPADAGQARQLIKSYSTGHATLEQVMDAIGRFEQVTEKRSNRRSVQVWVSPRLTLVDDHIYENMRVWNPEKGEFTISARFVLKAARGAAVYHVMSREDGSDYSAKRGSFVEIN